MQLSPGDVVRSIAGRDRKHLYVVVALAPNRALLADGRSRTLARPKAKNPLHLHLAKQKAISNITDDEIRQILRSITAESQVN